MNIQTGDEDFSRTEPTNFTVLRVKRDILRRSTIGAMFTNRSVGASAALPGSNQAYGVDGAFSFYQNVAAGAYYARTETEGLDGDNESYQGRVEYGAGPLRRPRRVTGGRRGLQSRSRLPAARPTSRRASCRCASARGPRASSRCASSPSRARSTTSSTATARSETRTQTVRFNTEFESSDQVTVEASDNYEALFVPFNVGGGVFIPRRRLQLPRRPRCPTRSGSSAASPAPSRCRPASSTTAR